MWIATIARPGALYGASASSQTFETIGGSIVNPSDSEEIVDVDFAMADDAENYSRMHGLGGVGRKFKKGCGSREVTEGGKIPTNRKPISKFEI